MTVKEIIDYTDKLKPNSFDFETKLAWLNQVEGMLKSEINKMPVNDIEMLTDEEDTLCAPHPYAQIYSFYIISMMDFFSGDLEKYRNSSVAYNDAMRTYAKFVARGGK